MRVTANTFTSALVDNLGRISSRQVQLQTQASTGQRVRNAEDDPVAMRRVLDLQAEGRTVAQYQRNIGRQQELATATFGIIKALKKISDRAAEIATLADGLKSPEELRIYAAEVNELIRQGVQSANAKNRGDYLLSGTKSDQLPFNLATNAAGEPASVAYAGNSDLSETEIAEGVTVSAQAVGANVGAGPRGLLADANAGADFFQHLIELRDHLAAGDSASIAATDRANLQRDEENLLYHVSLNGAVQARLEASAAAARDRSETLEGNVSTEVDVDLAQTLVKLSQTQTAYQAALQTGGTILQLSLLDYIR